MAIAAEIARVQWRLHFWRIIKRFHGTGDKPCEKNREKQPWQFFYFFFGEVVVVVVI